MISDGVMEQINALKAERDRYRDALKGILNANALGRDHDWEERICEALRLAQEALEGK